MSLITKLATKLLEPKARAFEEATKNPLEAQKKALLEYLHRNQNTEYGRRYNFAGIRSIEDYRRCVPMSDYESIRPYVEHMKRGVRNVLTADRPVFFGVTSGTTDQPKYIPVTKYSRAKKAELMDLWTYYILKSHPDILRGKVLTVISPDTEGVTESGVPYGAESGHAYKNLPGFVKRMYAVPYEVFTIEDYAARYYCILRIGMGEDISTLAVLNPSAIVLLCQRIAEWQELIIDDIGKGTLSGSFNIEAKVRSFLERRMKPDPERAGELRRILKEKLVLLPKDFWPKMVLIECWKGGTVKLYLNGLPQYFGDLPVRDFGCLSTEARSSIPMSDAGAGGVLAISANFYEFIPKEDIDKPDARALLCNELEKGREYFLIVTTPGGLYRYDMDDIIVVNGFFNKTPLIEFVQKGMNAVSLTGEKVYESQVNAAVLRAVEKNGLLIKFFSATIEATVPGRYIFLVEFDGAPGLEEKRGLLRAIEEGLRGENREYNDLRNEGVLGDPVLKVVKAGDFEKYRSMKISQGAHDGQFKAPELTGDTGFQKNFEIVEEVRTG
ncbi:MAG: GH3 auxin-responsive promoter family protein [Candidatus Omnitrophota bacterium]|nr:GH3 auxin-responsive promoter family protein [Candidatus Omnitrophota bacterium]